MNNFSFYRMFGTIKNCFNEHFSCHKKWYFILSGVVVFSIVMGLIVGINIAPNATASKIPDSTLFAYINGDTSLIGVFFARFFSTLGILILVWVTNCKSFLSFITFLILVYKGFNLGVTCAFLVILFSLGGVLNVVFVIIPCNLILLFILIGWSSVCLNYNFECRNFGGSILSKEFYCSIKLILYVFLIVLVLVCLLEILLLPWLSTAIIIS